MVNLQEYLVYRQKHCRHEFQQVSDKETEYLENICIFCNKVQYEEEEEDGS